MTQASADFAIDIDTSVARAIRIAYVVHTFDTGGLERSIAHLVNGLPCYQFSPLIVCLNRNGAAAQWLDHSGVPIIELRKRSGNDWRAVCRMATVFKSRKVDVVHSHNWGTLVEASLAARWARVPCHVHSERGTVLGSTEIHGCHHRLRGLAMNWTLRRTSAVITNAVSVATRISQRSGFPRESIIVVPNGVNPPRVGNRQEARISIRRQLGIAGDAIVIGSIGRLVAVKNFQLAIRALSELAATNQNLHLILVGDGPERGALQQAAESPHLANRVHFAGERPDIGQWLAAMDIYVNTSCSEGMSQSIIEAMALGMPMVVTDVGDNALLVGGSNPCGLVVPSNDAPALVKAMRSLIQAPGQVSLFAENAKAKHVAEYSFPVMIRRYETLYARMLSESGSRGGNSLRGHRQ